MSVEPTPFERMGGLDGVRALVDRFYDLMEELSEAAPIRAMHPKDLRMSREKLTMFLCGWMGGPPLYIERFGHPRLRARHLPFPIADDEANQWMLCMRRALDELKDTDLADFLAAAFERTALHMRNQAPRVGSEELGSADQISALDFAGGTLLATGPGGEFLIWRWDERSTQWVTVDDVPRGGLRSAAGLTPDGAGVYVSDRNTVQTAPIRKRLRKLTAFYASPDTVRRLLWSMDGGILLVQTSGQTEALDWTGTRRWTCELSGPTAWSPDGEVVIGTVVGLVWLDGASGEELRRLDFGHEPRSLAIASGGAIAVSWGGGDDGAPVEVHVWDGKALVPADCGGLRGVQALAFSPDGSKLAGACLGGDVAVWSASGGRVLRARSRHESLGQVVWIDGRRFAVAGRHVDRGPAVVIFEA